MKLLATPLARRKTNRMGTSFNPCPRNTSNKTVRKTMTREVYTPALRMIFLFSHLPEKYEARTLLTKA
jgi:hypothetical protein